MERFQKSFEGTTSSPTSGKLKLGTELREQQMIIAKRDYVEVGVFENTQQGEAARAIIQALLNSKNHSIDGLKVNELVPDKGIRQNLLAAQVFAYHPSDGTVTFQSKRAEVFAKEHFGRVQ